MATLDQIAKEKKGKKTKKQGGMASAVSSTEKIRTWVRSLEVLIVFSRKSTPLIKKISPNSLKR